MNDFAPFAAGIQRAPTLRSTCPYSATLPRPQPRIRALPGRWAARSGWYAVYCTPVRTSATTWRWHPRPRPIVPGFLAESATASRRRCSSTGCGCPLCSSRAIEPTRSLRFELRPSRRQLEHGRLFRCRRRLCRSNERRDIVFRFRHGITLETPTASVTTCGMTERIVRQLSSRKGGCWGGRKLFARSSNT